MRALLVSGLAASLIGCTCLVPPQATWQECTDTNGLACFGGMAASPQIHPKPTASEVDPVARPAKRVAAKREAPRSAQLGDRSDPVLIEAKSTIAAKMEAPRSAQLGDRSDPVLIKAKSTIAAKMEDPVSVEFGEMKRAVRKNTLGKRIDTICGYVKGKNASGGDTGERPFLYLVQDDEAYIVDGSGDGVAATAYRNICN